jgi:DNA-binding MarR family transcriptional regulator
MDKSWFTQTEVFLLHEIVTRLDRLARKRVLDARGVSYPEFLIAMAVREMTRPTQGEIGELLDMSKSLVSQRVTTLMAKGLVVQQRDERNRRNVRLELTAPGEAALEEIYSELATKAARVFGALGAARAEFLTSLRVIQDALAAEEALAYEADEHAGYRRYQSG